MQRESAISCLGFVRLGRLGNRKKSKHRRITAGLAALWGAFWAAVAAGLGGPGPWAAPVLLAGAAADWPAAAEWDFAWFARRYGREPLPLTTFDERAGSLPFGALALGGAARGEDVLALREDQEFLHAHPELLDMVDCAALLPGAAAVDEYLWLGPAGTVTGLHADLVPANVLVQLSGRKRLLFFPPAAAAALHAEPEPRGDYGHYAAAGLDPEAPDLARFPRFAEAPPPVEVELGPGDALVIPCGWFHHVRYLEDSISVGCQGFASLSEMEAPPPSCPS